jgi:HAD superfamily hydrolase (TIGR01459 family)
VSGPARRPRSIGGLEQVVESFDHVLLDQWGVLHDGQTLYPQVHDCLDRLRARGKTVTVLSNSGRRGAENARRLEKLGLPRSAYDRIITSGDAVWAALAARDTAPFDALGRRCLLFTRGNDRSVVEGLDLELVRRVQDADFILLAGLDEDLADLGRWHAVLEQAAAAALPVVCANPDTTMLSGRGLLPGPGAVAGLYQSLGGHVDFVGKPHCPIYATALEALGNPPPRRVLAVGDSLDHDVLGAARIGAMSLFIIDGVQAPHFAGVAGDPAITTTLRRLAGADGPLPDWVMQRLAWSAHPAGDLRHG